MDDQLSFSGPPAFTSLLPGYPGLEEVDDDRARIVRAFAAREGRVRSLGACEGLEGRYVIEGKGSEPALFVKVFPESIASLQAHGARVASYLAARGVPVLPALEAQPGAVAPGYRGIAFPYFEARFSRLVEPELEAIGMAIARTHGALREYPDRDAVRESGARLAARLDRAARAILADAGAGPRELRREAAEAWLAGGWTILQEPQMVHGDCNYTNALFGIRSAELRLIDFEESACAWLSPTFDVAVALQRFALAGPLDRRPALIDALRRGYVRAGGVAPPLPRLGRAMLEAAYRSVLILVEKVAAGMAIPTGEWAKFERLVRLGHSSASLFEREREIRP